MRHTHRQIDSGCGVLRGGALLFGGLKWWPRRRGEGKGGGIHEYKQETQGGGEVKREKAFDQ